MKIQMFDMSVLNRVPKILSATLVALVIMIPTGASAVAPQAQDKASPRALERSNSRSTEPNKQGTNNSARNNKSQSNDGQSDSTVSEADSSPLCSNRERTLRNKVSAYGKVAEVRKQQLDAKLERILLLSKKYDLKTPEVENLIIAARLVGSRELEPAIINMQKLPETAPIGCGSPTAVTSLAAIKTTTTETKDALNEYRQSIKAIALALQSNLDKRAL